MILVFMYFTFINFDGFRGTKVYFIEYLINQLIKTGMQTAFASAGFYNRKKNHRCYHRILSYLRC